MKERRALLEQSFSIGCITLDDLDRFLLEQKRLAATQGFLRLDTNLT